MAKGYGALIDVFGGAQSFLQLRMLETGTYEKLAKANGEAINGLQPKITTWSTGKYHVSLSNMALGLTVCFRKWALFRRFHGTSTGHNAESPTTSKHNP